MIQPPRRRDVLPWHVLATVFQSSSFGAISILPVLARLRFGASDWQTMLVTAAVPTLLVASIFWEALLRRTRLPRYLAIHWSVAILPLALISAAHSYGYLVACFLVTAVGSAGWSPVEGRLMQAFYAERSRGRHMGVITAARLVGGMLSAYGVGKWLSADPDAFRLYLPLIAGLQVVGLAILARLAVVVGAHTPLADAAPRWRDVLSPFQHMREVLRADRVFLRYEQAFMTYGIGWMICTALLPVLVTTQLGMNYREVANSTQVVLQIAMLIVTYPMGWINDRLGPVRMSAISFALLAVYPLGLLAARGVGGVAAITAVYGVAMAGVQMGWLLGPITLADRPERVPQYVAIHATLVGVRAVLGQGVGMLLYTLTGSLFWSFALAAAAFAWAAVQMVRLHGHARTAPAPPDARGVSEPDRAAQLCSGGRPIR